MRVYADNAATTKMSIKAIDAMLPYLNIIYGNPSGLYEEGRRAREAVDDARNRIGNHFRCSGKEIIFTSGGSEADTQAVITAAATGEKSGKKHIISTAFEHHAVLNALESLKTRGFEITLIDIPEDGIVKPGQIQKALREDTCMVSVMYANNEIGTIQPISEIGKICREHNVLFHTDAVQAAGHINIDVVRDNVDMMSISAHKFHGPKGAGALYMRKGIRASRVIFGGAQERGRRAGTENVPAIMGMAAALDEACEHMEINAERTVRLRNRLIDRLSEVPHSILNGSLISRLPGNVSFSFEAVEGETMLILLDQKGICASSGSACASGSIDPSHVITALGRPHEIALGTLRLTIGEETTEKEIDYIIDAVKGTVETIRSCSPVWRELQAGRRDYVLK